MCQLSSLLGQNDTDLQFSTWKTTQEQGRSGINSALNMPRSVVNLAVRMCSPKDQEQELQQPNAERS